MTIAESFSLKYNQKSQTHNSTPQSHPSFRHLLTLVLPATYDRDIFVETSCTNKSTTTQIAPCATQDDGCIDTRQVNGTLDGTAFSYHHFTVANPVTCDNVLISLT
jgi:hypothetical protein